MVMWKRLYQKSCTNLEPARSKSNKILEMSCKHLAPMLFFAIAFDFAIVLGHQLNKTTDVCLVQISFFFVLITITNLLEETFPFCKLISVKIRQIQMCYQRFVDVYYSMFHVRATSHLTIFDIPMRPLREDQRHR